MPNYISCTRNIVYDTKLPPLFPSPGEKVESKTNPANHYYNAPTWSHGLLAKLAEHLHVTGIAKVALYVFNHITWSGNKIAYETMDLRVLQAYLVNA